MNRNLLALAILSLSALGFAAKPKGKTDYCNLECGRIHTMCMYEDEVGPNCEGFIDRRLSKREKEYILEYHNGERNRVAQGEVNGLPRASNMMELEWDEELATIANRWARQCTFQHDICRDTSKYYVGQNLALYSTTGRVDKKKMYKRMVNDWSNESKDVSGKIIGSFRTLGGEKIGHFTQLVWGKTSRLGCALSETDDGEWTTYTLVCNYGPGGNVIGQPVYYEGDPCSRCPEGASRSRTYPALCS